MIINEDAAPSRRELEVLRLLWVGCTYQEAAEYLNIGKRTVGSHMESLYKKLDVHNMRDAFQKMGWGYHLIDDK